MSDGKVTVTPGPWEAVVEGDEGTVASFPLRSSGGKAIAAVWSRDGRHVTPESVVEGRLNALLIEAAVNSCFQVSPENPKAVAEAIPEAFNLLREFTYITKDAHPQSLCGQARYLLSRLGIEERKG